MADSITKLIELNLSFARVLLFEIFCSLSYLTVLMLVLEHSIINSQYFNSLVVFYFLWFLLRYFPDLLSDLSLCFLVFSFDVIYFASSGLYASFVLFYFYSVQPCLQDNLQKESFEFAFMHFYVFFSNVLVNFVLDIVVSVSRYLLIAYSV